MEMTIKMIKTPDLGMQWRHITDLDELNNKSWQNTLFVIVQKQKVWHFVDPPIHLDLHPAWTSEPYDHIQVPLLFL